MPCCKNTPCAKCSVVPITSAQCSQSRRTKTHRSRWSCQLTMCSTREPSWEQGLRYDAGFAVPVLMS